MEVLCGRQNVQNDMMEQINNLFLMNYKKYHYTCLTNFDGIQQLLAQKTFECVCACENKRVIGFAAFYECKHKNYPVNSYKLAHLLVDCNCRGKGIGSVLEDSRLLMISKRYGKKVIYASCVEQPKNSIYMKLNRGFRISGFKYHYRIIDTQKENALILVNTALACDDQLLSVTTGNELTKRIIQESNPNVVFSNDTHINNNIKYSIDISNDKNIGRMIGHIYTNHKSKEDLSTLPFPNRYMGNYIGIVVNPSIEGFFNIDNFLQSKKYYPISYVPYLNDKFGELEYQYLPHGIEKVLDDRNVSCEGKDFIKKLIENTYSM